jgi:hypothetical protein
MTRKKSFGDKKALELMKRYMRLVNGIVCHNIAFVFKVKKKDDGRYYTEIDIEQSSILDEQQHDLNFMGESIEELNKEITEYFQNILSYYDSDTKEKKYIPFSVILGQEKEEE